jgi:hypothetical protein
VLSGGYPLYESLAPFVYRDPGRLLLDFKERRLALRDDTVPELMRLMDQWAHPELEARSLLEFLDLQLERKAGAPATPTTRSPTAVIHGRHALGALHKLARRVDALSVASPFCNSTMNFDVRLPLAADGEGCEVLIADRCRSMVSAEVQAALVSHGKFVDTNYYKVDVARLLPGFAFEATALARTDTAMSIVASFPSVMAGVEAVLGRLFPGVRCYHAEHSALPWFLRPSARPCVSEPT